jgi:hypothetical protein
VWSCEAIAQQNLDKSEAISNGNCHLKALLPTGIHGGARRDKRGLRSYGLGLEGGVLGDRV